MSASPPTWSVDSNLSPEQFAALRDRIATYGGVYLDESRQAVLRQAVGRRSAALGMPALLYLARVLGPEPGSELAALAELVLNHETVFFRNQPQFRALREAVLPELHRRLPPGRPLRIWSAGCATGEEPYSLAIAALEVLGDPLPRPVEIIASDLSHSALARARAGMYRGRTLGNLSPPQLARHFEQRGEHYSVGQAVRRLVTFVQHNLLEPFPPQVGAVDIIFCQNVTIYFRLETCRALMGRIHRALAPEGYLFLGFSETLWNIYDGLRSQELLGAFLYRNSPARPAAQTGPLSEPRPAGLPRPTGVLAPPVGRRQRPAPPPPPTLRASPELIRQGHALLDAARVDEALELLGRAPLVGPSAPAILALTARALANRGDLDLAVAQARRALELDALTTEAYILLGMIYAQQEQLGAAAAQLERARYLAGEEPLVAYHLADIYRRMSRREAALREYREALRKLEPLPPDHLLDGVAVRWLRETCQRNIETLTATRR